MVLVHGPDATTRDGAGIARKLPRYVANRTASGLLAGRLLRRHLPDAGRHPVQLAYARRPSARVGVRRGADRPHRGRDLGASAVAGAVDPGRTAPRDGR